MQEKVLDEFQMLNLQSGDPFGFIYNVDRERGLDWILGGREPFLRCILEGLRLRSRGPVITSAED